MDENRCQSAITPIRASRSTGTQRAYRPSEVVMPCNQSTVSAAVDAHPETNGDTRRIGHVTYIANPGVLSGDTSFRFLASSRSR